MPMRWRWPPENSCGIAVACVGREADLLEQLADAVAPRRAPRPMPWIVERLADDVADAQARIEDA